MQLFKYEREEKNNDKCKIIYPPCNPLNQHENQQHYSGIVFLNDRIWRHLICMFDTVKKGEWRSVLIFALELNGNVKFPVVGKYVRIIMFTEKKVSVFGFTNDFVKIPALDMVYIVAIFLYKYSSNTYIIVNSVWFMSKREISQISIIKYFIKKLRNLLIFQTRYIILVSWALIFP